MPDDGRSISRNVAHLNILVHDVINFLYYRYWTDKQKYFYVYILSSFVRVKILFMFCWNSIPCLTRKEIFLSQNFLSFPSPHHFIPLFLSVILQNTWKPTNMKQVDKSSIKKITLYKFLLQIYIRITPLVVFYSFWVR